MMGKHDMPWLKNFQLRFYSKLLNTLRHHSKMLGRVNKNGFTEIKGADVQGADIGSQFFDMKQSL